ncbi:Uncharacterized protein SCF082_LOCUS40624 [Durusdinium trenchii]|uniref:Uncharacterized protein n=1 Tax=Durusdinium trenchii TaxID=1381693 RepID=A0ABP0QDU2_9DINO
MAAPASLQSKQWSCASLAAGNNHLLQVKSEESRQRQADLEARKKAIQAEIEAIQQEERQLEPVPEVPEVMDELPASAKRMPPNSTKTTPVKKLAVVKKRREGEVPGVRKGYAMVDARLRRLCEKKPSGKLNVPQDIHNMWLAGGHSRDNLRALLEKFEFDKDGWESYIKDAVAYCKKHGLVKSLGWLVQALEAKIQAAQAAFDTFVECRSQVSCRDAIRQARVTRNPSKGLQRLAAVPLKKSETGAHQTFKAFGQSLDLKISRVDLVSKSRFPYVSLSDWLKYVVENDSLEQIVGVKDLQDMQPLLTTFWSRFRFSHPHHKMYDPLESGAPQHHSMTIPIVMHGDEGRGRKKKQITILSWMGLLGRGSSRCSGSGSSGDPEPVCSLNLLGSTWLTHFLHSVLPVGLYSNQPEALDEVFALQARELATLFYDGVEIGGRVFYVACVGVKGDVPFLTKCGGFIRSYTRKPTAKSSRKAGVGICHLCCAGKEDFEYPVPFEELGVEHPSWLSTVGLEKPYSSDPPYALVPFERDGTDVGKLYRFDIFHNLHLGLGKSFVSSAVCMVLELCQGMSIGAAFGKLSEDFRRYCVRNSESPYHKTLKASLFGVHTGFKECPDGAWSKGDYTRLLLEWFGDYCSREVGGRTDDPVYLLCVSNRHSVYLFFGL